MAGSQMGQEQWGQREPDGRGGRRWQGAKGPDDNCWNGGLAGRWKEQEFKMGQPGARSRGKGQLDVRWGSKGQMGGVLGQDGEVGQSSGIPHREWDN